MIQALHDASRRAAYPAFFAILCLAAPGCAGSGLRMGPDGEPLRIPGDGPTGFTPPFIAREGSLPEGFPPPGPVGVLAIKEYPVYRRACASSDAKGIESGGNELFRPLFNHIRRNDIAMTVPVEMAYPDPPASGDANDEQAGTMMAFLYGEPEWGQAGTDSEDARVEVEDIGAMTVLSVGVRGPDVDQNYQNALTTVKTWLAANATRMRQTGRPRLLAYNSPFIMSCLRYGEVQIPVEIVEADDPS